MSTRNWKSVLFGNTSIFGGIAAKIIEYISVGKESETINEVLFYGAGEEKKKKQLGLNNLFCIYYVLVHASETVDVCMPSLDSDTISKCLIEVHQKNNTKVRIVVHRNLGMNLKCFLDCGIEVKISRGEVGLEHEFILIDAVGNCEEALAIIGSLDYEVNRVNCNNDSTLLTSENTVVSTLKREFDRIWNSSEYHTSVVVTTE